MIKMREEIWDQVLQKYFFLFLFVLKRKRQVKQIFRINLLKNQVDLPTLRFSPVLDLFLQNFRRCENCFPLYRFFKKGDFYRTNLIFNKTGLILGRVFFNSTVVSGEKFLDKAIASQISFST